MAISRDVCEAELASCEAALIAHREGVEVNLIVIEAFKKALATLPPAKKKKNAVIAATG